MADRLTYLKMNQAGNKFLNKAAFSRVLRRAELSSAPSEESGEENLFMAL